MSREYETASGHPVASSQQPASQVLSHCAQIIQKSFILDISVQDHSRELMALDTIAFTKRHRSRHRRLIVHIFEGNVTKQFIDICPGNPIYTKLDLTNYGVTPVGQPLVCQGLYNCVCLCKFLCPSPLYAIVSQKSDHDRECSNESKEKDTEPVQSTGCDDAPLIVQPFVQCQQY